MPIYEYACERCTHEFEELVRGDERPSCPRCASERLTKKLSSFARPAAAAQSQAPSPGACGTCGDPRGAGACADQRGRDGW